MIAVIAGILSICCTITIGIFCIVVLVVLMKELPKGDNK